MAISGFAWPTSSADESGKLQQRYERVFGSPDPEHKTNTLQSQMVGPVRVGQGTGILGYDCCNTLPRQKES